MYRLGLIGNPVKHSKSPEIHSYFLEQAGLEGSYSLFQLKENQINDQINWMKSEGFRGFNVTIPFKEKIVEYLDELDETAHVMQSVNTVKIQNNRLVGYNTDGDGYVLSLEQTYPDFFIDVTGKHVLLIGAGGAAKGIAHKLNDYPFKTIDCANRTKSKADNISQILKNSQSFNLDQIINWLSYYDLIIQTTSVGMEPYADEQIIPLEGVKPGSIVSDIVYKPKWTRFLQDAKQQGSRLLFGESMLWYQAVKAFEIWTNHDIRDANI